MDMQMDNYHQHLYVPGQEIEKPKTKWIWNVFWVLLAITTVEVVFAFANGWGLTNGERHYLQPTPEKWFFITLTLVKAYAIVFYFMHLGDEKKNFKFTILSTTVFLLYFIALMMFEGYALRDIQLVRPDFFKRTYQPHHSAAGHEDHGAAKHEEGAKKGEAHQGEHAAPASEEAHH